MKKTKRFPSPFGVICSLISFTSKNHDSAVWFPSPFGVICSLIRKILNDEYGV